MKRDIVSSPQSWSRVSSVNLLPPRLRDYVAAGYWDGFLERVLRCGIPQRGMTPAALQNIYLTRFVRLSGFIATVCLVFPDSFAAGPSVAGGDQEAINNIGASC